MSLNTTYRAILEAARARKFISYGDIAKANGLTWNEARFKMNHHLENQSCIGMLKTAYRKAATALRNDETEEPWWESPDK